MKLELKKIGNSTGLILPKELLARLGLQQPMPSASRATTRLSMATSARHSCA